MAHSPASQPWVQSQVTGGSLQRDGPGGFVLDLHNIPDLSKADINGQNPNIQVTGFFEHCGGFSYSVTLCEARFWGIIGWYDLISDII